MSVEFYENKTMNYNYQPQKGGLTSMFIKWGLAKDEARAKKLMLIMTILCFALSFYFFYKALF